MKRWKISHTEYEGGYFITLRSTSKYGEKLGIRAFVGYENKILKDTRFARKIMIKEMNKGLKKANSYLGFLKFKFKKLYNRWWLKRKLKEYGI